MTRLATRLTGALAALTATAVIAGCASGAAGTSDATLTIVGFAVPEAANKALAEEFAATDEGEGLKFRTSYGASGDQSRAVVGGLKADYVHFSVSSDVTRLVDEGLVAQDWDQGDNRGIVSNSIVVFGVREGNPKNIRSWNDLTKPGVGIVTANPASSGAARWNALAAYGQVIENGGAEAGAEKYVGDLFANVVSLTNSGRDATTSFLGGTGDVLLAYENEAILAAQNGQGFDYIIPDTTMLIENPGAILEDAVPEAKSWLDFVLSDAGQKQFALKGFRPIRDDVDFGGTVEGAPDPKNPFPAVPRLLTVEKNFGGWKALTPKFFDEKDGIISKAITASGKAR